MTKDHSDDPTLASVIGKGYAYVQHGMDKVIEWGFAKMNEAAKEEPGLKKKSAADDTTTAKLFAVGRGALRFFGEAGRTYYDTYRELKKKDTK